MTRDKRLKKFAEVTIYPVTCEKLSNGRSDIEILNGVIKGGAKIIQLREKDISKRVFYRLAKEFREITALHGLLLIINDHVDIALSVNADGVHLGQNDLPVSAARELAPEMIIGASTHDEEEAAFAIRAGADYINIGPVFPTKTKEGVTDFIGVDRVKEISKDITIPFTVMGGIGLDNVDELLRIGVRKIAVVSAITMSGDIARTTEEFIKKIISHT